MQAHGAHGVVGFRFSAHDVRSFMDMLSIQNVCNVYVYMERQIIETEPAS